MDLSSRHACTVYDLSRSPDLRFRCITMKLRNSCAIMFAIYLLLDALNHINWGATMNLGQLSDRDTILGW